MNIIEINKYSRYTESEIGWDLWTKWEGRSGWLRRRDNWDGNSKRLTIIFREKENWGKLKPLEDDYDYRDCDSRNAIKNIEVTINLEVNCTKINIKKMYLQLVKQELNSSKALTI